MRPTKFTYEIREVLNDFSKEVNSEKIKPYHPRIHKNNVLNKRFLGVYESFLDLESVTERLEEGIKQSIEIESKIQSQMEIDQELHKKSSRLTGQNKADLKTIYINSKIFLDDYVSLLRHIFNWRSVGDRSVTNFYNDLEKYNGDDRGVLAFKKICLKKLKAIDVYVTNYRDDEVVHNQKKHKSKTKWFLNNMNGEIMFFGGSRPSLTPQEILFVVVEFVDHSARFCIKWLKDNHNSE